MKPPIFKGSGVKDIIGRDSVNNDRFIKNRFPEGAVYIDPFRILGYPADNSIADAVSADAAPRSCSGARSGSNIAVIPP
jgi:hypothetical protein